MDHRFPHQVNHIIVGNLGDFEIVLLAYDDGDTLAYYTHSIVHHITQSSDRTRSPGASSTSKRRYPKPFFHDNVGESAWGLAVHEKSRLIAVSSNLREVTVFAFALAQRNGSSLRRTEHRPIPAHSLLGVQKDLRSRSREWRIVLPLNPDGGNIPNVSFTDDEMGDAEKVVARDVSGALWFLDIWRLGVPHVRWRDTYGKPRLPNLYVYGFGCPPCIEANYNFAVITAGACWCFPIAASGRRIRAAKRWASPGTGWLSSGETSAATGYIWMSITAHAWI